MTCNECPVGGDVCIGCEDKIQDNPNRQTASEIIDMVIDAILEDHEWLKIICEKYMVGNTLLHGEAYYNLEDRLTEELPTMVNVEVD